MAIFNPYTNTSDQPVPSDFAGYGSTNMTLHNQAKAQYQAAKMAWIIKYKIPQAILDEWSAAEINWLANNSVSAQQSFWQNMKDKYATASNNVSNAWQNTTVGQNVIAAANSISNAWQGSLAGQLAIQAQNNFNAFLSKITDENGELTILALLPFKHLMVAALKARGVKVNNSDSLTMIAVMFNDVIVNNKHSFEYSHYDRLNHFGNDGDNMASNGGSAEGAMQQIAAAAVAALSKEAIKALVSGITGFIKRIFTKKAKGETLSDEESKIMNDASTAMVNVATGGDGESTDWTPLLKFIGAVGAFLTVVKIIKMVKGKPA